MRSVVVVLPASMWAMMPMLRVRSRGNSRLAISVLLPLRRGDQKGRAGPGGPQARESMLAATRTPNTGSGPSRRRVPVGRSAFERSARTPAAAPENDKTRPQGGSSIIEALGSPAVVGEGLVALGHLLHVVAALDRSAEAVGGIEQFAGEAFGHRLLATLAAEVDEPTDGERVRARRAHLDRHLIGRATDTPAAHLERRLDVLDRPLEGRDRLCAALLLD